MFDPMADIQTQVVCRDGAVHLLFSRDVEGELRPAETHHVIWGAAEALRAGQCIIDMAFEADTGLKPLGPAAKAELVERHRKKLIPRLELMIKRQREQPTMPNRKFAVTIMDIVCSEIFS